MTLELDSRPTLVSIVVPVYGGCQHLAELVSRVDQAFAAHADLDPAEIVLVDDCGPHDSWTTIRALAARRENVVAIRLMRNFGQHNAIMCGFKHATGDIVVTIDDDLQHEPESIPQLIDQLRQSGDDLVYGVYDDKQHSSGRNLGSWLINRFYRLVFRMPITTTSFRAIRRELVQATLRYDLNFTFIDGLLAWNTQRISTTVVPHNPRAEGKSGYTLRSLFSLAMNVFTNFSLLPLQFVSFIGFVSAMLGFALGLWYLFIALSANIAVPGYASTIIVILVLGGIQLLSLGVIGEYLGRMHLNVNRKPQYTEREVIRDNDGDEEAERAAHD